MEKIPALLWRAFWRRCTTPANESRPAPSRSRLGARRVLVTGWLLALEAALATGPAAQTLPSVTSNDTPAPIGRAESQPPQTPAAPPTRQIIDRRAKVIETGLEPLSEVAISGFPIGDWISDDVVMLNARQDVPDADLKKLQRVVLFDTRTGAVTTLVPEGRQLCWNPELRVTSIAPLIYRQGLGRLYRLGEDLKLHEMEGDPGIDTDDCSPHDARPPGRAAAAYLRDSDGYIIFGNNTQVATWIKPGQPPRILPVPADEIHAGRILYLPFLQKYWLHDTDSQGNSGTDARVHGPRWNRPYALSPYRFMALDGSLEIVPYPYFLADYGIKGFGYVIPSKAGLLFNRGREILLLQGEQLIRVWSGKRIIGRTEVNPVFSMSPDGCKLLFPHYPDTRFLTPKPVSIINVCELK